VTVGLEGVLGDIDQHWPGPSSGSNVKRLVNRAWQLSQGLDQEVMLGPGPRDPKGIGFLKRIAADQFAGDLAGDGDNRNRIHHGVDQTRHQIGGAGTRSGAAHTHLASRPRVALGREGGVLLVPDQDVLNGRVIDGVIKRQCHAAWVPKDNFYLFTC